MRYILTLLFCLLPLFAYANPPETYEGLSEITSERNYNTKVYDNSQAKEGSKRYCFRGRHVHYKKNGKFEDINVTLSFDGKWKQSKASYHCAIPEYADDWFEFYNVFEETNHTIKAKPICNHIKGKLLPNQNDGLGHESIVYKNAFGKDIDLRVGVGYAGLRKMIIVQKKPQVLQDLIFDFELEIPQDADVIDKENKKWDKETTLKFKDKALRIGKNNKYSYFERAKIWDSKEPRNLQEWVDIELYKQGDKIYLRKTILKEILETAVYPLYTDHPTKYYPHTADGRIRYNDADWDSTHDSGTGTVDNGDAEEWMWLQANYISRCYLTFDTSAITDSDNIDSGTFGMYNTAKTNNDNDGQDFLVIVESKQNSATALQADDFVDCGDLVDDPTEGSNRLDFGSISIPAWFTLTLDADGLGWVSKTGYTMLGMREGHDVEDDNLTNSNALKLRWADQADTTTDPYLDVTTSAGAPSAFIPKIMMF